MLWISCGPCIFDVDLVKRGMLTNQFKNSQPRPICIAFSLPRSSLHDGGESPKKRLYYLQTIMASNDSKAGPLGRVWEDRYSERKSEKSYKAEDPRRPPDQSIFPGGSSLIDFLENGDLASFVRSFVGVSRDCLIAPLDHSNVVLREYLMVATKQELEGRQDANAGQFPRTILIDDRRDPVIGRSTSRRWDGPGGYLEYPPEGANIWPDQPTALSFGDFISRLKNSVRSPGFPLHWSY